MSLPPATSEPSSTSKPKAVETKIFIDQDVSEYSLLSSCAEQRVSTIVRDMSDGCGDQSQMTSYLCFCQTSSSYFDSFISSRIARTCNDQAQASLGQAVFSKYCQVGSTSGRIPACKSATSAVFVHNIDANVRLTAASASSTAASSLSITSSVLISSISTSATIQTLSASSLTPSSTPSSSSSNGRTRTIALAVSIPIAVIALLAAAFLFYRYRKGPRARELGSTEVVELSSEKGGRAEASELAVVEKHRHAPAELPTNQKRTGAMELPDQQFEDHK
jgi:hypothetical protein